MFTAIHRKLNQIQESSDAVRKQWLIIASSLMMVLVVGLWLLSFDFFPLDGSAGTASTNESMDSFFAIMKNGAGVLWVNNVPAAFEKISRGVSAFFYEFSGLVFQERTITVDRD